MTVLFVTLTKVRVQLWAAASWIPAFAGMTMEGPGMRGRDPRICRWRWPDHTGKAGSEAFAGMTMLQGRIDAIALHPLHHLHHERRSPRISHWYRYRRHLHRCCGDCR